MPTLSMSPVLVSLANVFKIPVSQTTLRPTIALLNQPAKSKPSPPRTQEAKATFSTTRPLLKRKAATPVDKRVTLIRYFLHHPLTPRPLRFSRNRYLRHWTIHRAWQLHQANRRRANQLELQRQWQAMNAACEELRTGAGDGGKLFRKSMIKTGVFRDMFPIEYGRLQTEGPGEGWNHEWTRPEVRR
ncbi:mitochondrial 54S ribosomal protein mL40 [Aspergillus lucknowensis]|uniref:Large ribosomal subunit protein mL40 n=1 Tax=Aspergillus lucknowensis TaxID=176173 RepID=A0ABR4LV02_9EURO